jgi:hypothetical protein
MKVRLHSQQHEWRSRDEENQVVIIRAEWDSIKWNFTYTTKKDPEWHDLPTPLLHHFEELREILFNKYQRRRLPWRFVEELDTHIVKMRNEESSSEE